MNPLPDYYELLARAWLASEDVDMFDVDSGNAESAERFAFLLRKSAEAQLALIDYITGNADAIRQALSGDLMT